MTTVTPNMSLLQKMLQSSAFVGFLQTYNLSITLVLGGATIFVIIFLFLNITKLSASADNDRRRQEAISGILVCLVCLAVMGSIDTVYAILLNLIFSSASPA